MDQLPRPGEVAYNPLQPLDVTNVYDHVNYMHTLQPRGREHDEAMRKLYGYIEEQITGLSENPNQPTFFDREVSDTEQLAQAVIAAAQQVRSAVIDRGRGQHGRKGDYFWDGAEDIQEQSGRLMSHLWAGAQRAGVSDDTWFEQVMMYKG